MKPKNFLLSLGALATVATPIITVIACGNASGDNEEDKTIPEEIDKDNTNNNTNKDKNASNGDSGQNTTITFSDVKTKLKTSIEIAYTKKLDDADIKTTVIQAFKDTAEYLELTDDEKALIDPLLADDKLTIDINDSKATFSDGTNTFEVEITIAVPPKKPIVFSDVQAKLSKSVRLSIGKTINDLDIKDTVINLFKDTKEFQDLTTNEKTLIDELITADNLTINVADSKATFKDDTNTFELEILAAPFDFAADLAKIEDATSDKLKDDFEVAVNNSKLSMTAVELGYTLPTNISQDVEINSITLKSSYDPSVGYITIEITLKKGSDISSPKEITIKPKVTFESVDAQLVEVTVPNGTKLDDADIKTVVINSLKTATNEYFMLTKDEKNFIDPLLKDNNLAIDETDSKATFTDGTNTIEFTIKIATPRLKDVIKELGNVSIEVPSETTLADDATTKNLVIDTLKASAIYDDLAQDKKDEMDKLLVEDNATVVLNRYKTTFQLGKDEILEVTIKIAKSGLSEIIDKFLFPEVKLPSGTTLADDATTKNLVIDAFKQIKVYTDLSQSEKDEFDTFLVDTNARINTSMQNATFKKGNDTMIINIKFAQAVIKTLMTELAKKDVTLPSGTAFNDDQVTKDLVIDAIKNFPEYSSLGQTEKDLVDDFISQGNLEIIDDFIGKRLKITDKNSSDFYTFNVKIAP